MSQIFEALRKAEAFDGIRGSTRDATESAAERRAMRPALPRGEYSDLRTWAGFDPIF